MVWSSTLEAGYAFHAAAQRIGAARLRPHVAEADMPVGRGRAAFDPSLECAPGAGQVEVRDLTG